jgi:hypothetical protein
MVGMQLGRRSRSSAIVSKHSQQAPTAGIWYDSVLLVILFSMARTSGFKRMMDMPWIGFSQEN